MEKFPFQEETKRVPEGGDVIGGEGKEGWGAEKRSEKGRGEKTPGYGKEKVLPTAKRRRNTSVEGGEEKHNVTKTGSAAQKEKKAKPQDRFGEKTIPGGESPLTIRVNKKKKKAQPNEFGGGVGDGRQQTGPLCIPRPKLKNEGASSSLIHYGKRH